MLHGAPMPTFAQTPPEARTGKIQTFCGADRSTIPASGLRLPPRDEAARKPDFLAFRKRLQLAIARKDSQTILSVTDPNVRLDFGGGAGADLLKQFMKDPGGDFWRELGRALALGGTFDEHGGFWAPYVFSVWPSQLDAFACLAITARAVPLRAQPSAGGRTLALLDH